MAKPPKVKSQGALPDQHHVLRWVPPEKCEVDPVTLDTIGPLPSAFQLKEGEKGLSVTWLEYFGGDGQSHYRSAYKAMYGSIGRRTKGSYTPAMTDAGCVAVGKVEDVKKTCAEKGAPDVAAEHIPGNHNEGHSELRAYPSDLEGLLEAMRVAAMAHVEDGPTVMAEIAAA